MENVINSQTRGGGRGPAVRMQSHTIRMIRKQPPWTSAVDVESLERPFGRYVKANESTIGLPWRTMFLEVLDDESQ